MGARQKLNVAYINGCLIVAALVGILAESRAAALLTFLALALGGCMSGEIRPRRRDRSSRQCGPRLGSGRGVGRPFFVTIARPLRT